MRILHDSRSLLVVHSPATVAKVVSAVALGLGCLMSLAAPVYLIQTLMLDRDVEKALGGGGTLGGLGLLIGGLAALGLYRANDKDYQFRGKEMQLVVHPRRGAETTIPLARIARAAVVAGEGDDSVSYGLLLKLRDPLEDMDLTQHWKNNDAELKVIADRINRFLNAHRDEPEDVSIDLADADPRTIAKAVLTNLWEGTPAKPRELAGWVMRAGVLFVCPSCGFQTRDVDGPPPYQCERCRQAGGVVLLQDRTPGRTIVVSCDCGESFSVPKSFAGTKRPCPVCGRKRSIPPA